jgi:uncharacterized protein (TIRG00374 family)
LKKNLLKALKTLGPIAFGLFLVWHTYTNTSPEDRHLIYSYIITADPIWVSLSLIIGVLSHLSRAIRWNYLLIPMGYHPTLKSNILIILMGYFANLGIPRSGEILRATALRTYEKVPFQKGFGTIITERIIDLIMLFLVIGFTLVLQTDVLLNFFEEKGVSWIKISIVILLLTLLGIVTLWLVFNSKHLFFVKIKDTIGDLFTGVFSVFKMEQKWAFIGHTLFIWAAYIGMFWVVKYTVPETITLDFSELLVAFVAGTFAMSATNGGIGLYPIAIQKSVAIFGISAVSGNALGWIMWISQTLLIVVLGGISFLIIPFVSAKNNLKNKPHD